MKFLYKGNMTAFCDKLKNAVLEYNNNDAIVDIFNKQTKVQVTISNNSCSILLEKDNPKGTQFWFISSIIEYDNHIIINGKIAECYRSKREKTVLALFYIFFWPIFLLICLSNEWTPFHSKKYRRKRLFRLLIEYIGCKRIY